MEKNVTFRHFNGSHPDLSSLAEDTLEKFQKFSDSIINGEVIFNNEKIKEVEIKLNMKKATLIASDSSDEFKKSLALASHKMERQLRKYKTKVSHN